MKDYLVLRLLDRLQWLFTRMGVNYGILRRILQVKLVLDTRRVPPAIGQGGKSKGKDTGKDKNYFGQSLLIYALIGLILVPMVLMGQNFMFQMSLVLGILMFMISSAMISDFSSVLLELKDRTILFSRPVDGRTLSTAKVIHALLYILSLTLSLSGAVLIASLIRHGVLFTLLFLVTLLFLDLFIVVVTALLYLLILRFFDGEKLRDLINYVQIVLSIVITIAYQLISRLFQVMNMEPTFTPHWWQFLLPPVWFAAPFELLLHGERSASMLSLSALALIVPLVSAAVFLRLAPSFERSLQKLMNLGAARGRRRGRLGDGMARIVCRRREDRTFYTFASRMMSTERDFKLRVYPSLGFSIIFPFVLLMNAYFSKQDWTAVTSGYSYLSLYFGAMMIPTLISMMKYSAQSKGAWIYRALPIADPAPIFRGTILAFLIRLVIPVFAVESVLFLVIFGIDILPDVLAVFIGMLLFTLLSFRMMGRELPFSRPYLSAQQKDGGRMLMLLLLFLLFGAVHFGAIAFVPYGIYGYLVLMLLLTAAAWRSTFRISWEQVGQDRGE